MKISDAFENIVRARCGCPPRIEESFLYKATTKDEKGTSPAERVLQNYKLREK